MFSHLEFMILQMINLSRDLLTDGYISYTFGPRHAEKYMAILFGVDKQIVVARCDQSGAFYVLNEPSRRSSPTVSINGQDAWLLDYDLSSYGSVVPQELWTPQRPNELIRYVRNAQIRVPVFFVNMDGSMGVPIKNASMGLMQLHDGQLPQPFSKSSELTVRIAVRTLFLPSSSHAHSPSLTGCIVVARL
jgi:hypothetical protein